MIPYAGHEPEPRPRRIGGRRQTKAERQQIIDTWLNVSPEAAQALADSRGLSKGYAYRLVSERGLLPRKRREWGRFREFAEFEGL